MAGETLDKTLKFGFDPAYLQQSTRNAAALRKELEQLAKVLGPLSQMLGWSPGGGSSAGAGQGRPAAGSRPQATPATAMNQRLLESKSFFSAIATSSKSALQTMTSALRTESTAQAQHIQRLKREVDKLTSSYAHLDQLRNQGIQLANPNAPMQVRAQLWNRMGELGEAQQLHDSMRSAQLRMVSQSGGPGKWGALYELAREEIGNVGSRFAGMMGVGPTTMQFGSAAVLGAVIGKTVWNAMKAGMQEAQQAPQDFLNRAATGSTPYAHAALAVKHGDLGLMQAYRLVQSNEQTRRAFGDLARGDSKGISGFERSASGGAAFDQSGWRRTMAGARAFGESLWGLNPLGAGNEAKRKLDMMAPEMTRSQIDYLQKYRESFPLHFEALNQFQQNAMGDVHAIRGLAMPTERLRSIIMTQRGTGAVTGVDEWKTNPALRLLRSFENRGISRGEVMAAFREIEGVGGLGTAQRLVGYGVQGQIGHLGGAGGILGTAAMTGDAGAFWNNLTNLVGRGSGGIDVGAASLYGQTVAGSLANGAAPTSGLGLLGAMTAYGRGGDAAGDMLAARFSGAGLAGIGRITQGRVDAYQAGTNLLSAIGAAPGASIGAQEYLATLDPRVMFDIVGGGAVPPELRARGITAGMVKVYSQKVLARTYDRAISAAPGQGPLNAVQRQTAAVRGQFGGSFGDYFRSLDKGQRADALVARGAFFSEVGLAESDLAGQSMARLEAGLGASGTLVGGKRVPGRGVGDAAAGSNELGLESQKSRFQGELEQERENMPSQLAADIKNMKQAATTYGNIANAVGTSASEVAAALSGLAKAINDARVQIVTGRMGPAR